MFNKVLNFLADSKREIVGIITEQALYQIVQEEKKIVSWDPPLLDKETGWKKLKESLENDIPPMPPLKERDLNNAVEKVLRSLGWITKYIHKDKSHNSKSHASVKHQRFPDFWFAPTNDSKVDWNKIICAVEVEKEIANQKGEPCGNYSHGMGQIIDWAVQVQKLNDGRKQWYSILTDLCFWVLITVELQSLQSHISTPASLFDLEIPATESFEEGSEEGGDVEYTLPDRAPDVYKMLRHFLKQIKPVKDKVEREAKSNQKGTKKKGKEVLEDEENKEQNKEKVKAKKKEMPVNKDEELKEYVEKLERKISDKDEDEKERLIKESKYVEKGTKKKGEKILEDEEYPTSKRKREKTGEKNSKRLKKITKY